MSGNPKPVRQAKPLPVPEALFGEPPKKCESCKADIWFWKNPKTGKWVPVNRDATSHFTTCDKPARFSKRLNVADRLTVSVRGCARCGAKEHADVEFQRLRRPAKDFQWWAPCPDTGEPILMRIFPTEGGT